MKKEISKRTWLKLGAAAGGTVNFFVNGAPTPTPPAEVTKTPAPEKTHLPKPSPTFENTPTAENTATQVVTTEIPQPTATETPKPIATETKVEYTSTVAGTPTVDNTPTATSTDRTILTPPVSITVTETPNPTNTQPVEVQPSVTPGQSEPLVVSGANAAKADVVGYGALVIGGVALGTVLINRAKHFFSKNK